MVARLLAKEKVAGSNPVFRSNSFLGWSQGDSPMYFRATEKESVCAHCNHPIAAGSLCISLAPIDDQDIEPSEFAVLHLECESCESGESCFVSYASKQSPIEAQDEGVCAYCHHGIEVGQPILFETILAIAEETEAEQAPQVKAGARLDKLGQGLATMRFFRHLASSRFRDLPLQLQRRFQRMGLGNGRGIRTPGQARALYEQVVPGPIRRLGRTEEYLRNRAASHIESVANVPGKAKSPTNIVLESAKANANRGSRNMNRLELLSIKAGNAVDASRVVGRAIAGGAARGAAWAALFEAPISAAVNGIHYGKGRKSGEEAVKSVAADTAKAGITGAAVGGGMVIVVAAGGGVILAPIALPIAVVAGSIFAVSSAFRIGRALSDEPKDDGELEAAWAALAFHVECVECDTGELCHDAFLRSVMASAT